MKDFDNHIFISYSHIDNEPLTEGQKGWIEKFHWSVEKRLAQLLGERPRVWRDPKLTGADLFGETLVETLSRSAILVTVLSPSYINSPWCGKELEEFIKHASKTNELRLPAQKSRVVKVIKTPAERYPPQLQEMLGYNFFQINQETGRPEEFSPEEQPIRDTRYWQKLEDLVQELNQLIRIFTLSSGQPAEPDTASSGITVYLAETTSDLFQERDQIRRELEQRGHLVLPDRELPLSREPLEAAVRDYLARSRLSVHLIGDRYGLIPELGEGRSIVRLQQELAAERDGEMNFAQLIWLPNELKPKDKSQQDYLDALKNSFNSNYGSELMQTSLEELKTVIHDKLREQEPKPQPTVVGQSGAKSIYLICDEHDFDASRPIYDYLFDAGFEVIYPRLDGDFAEVAETHKTILLNCDAVLIYYGRSNGTWVQMKLLELQKIAGYGRTSPLRAKAVYLGAPEDRAKSLFRTHGAMVIRNFGDFTPDLLTPFLAQF